MVILNDQFMFYLLLVPVALPVYVATYSIIGEGDGNLRPVGHACEAPAAPAGQDHRRRRPGGGGAWPPTPSPPADVLIANRVVFGYIVRPVWTLGMLIHGPLLGLLSASPGDLPSRMNDPRAAQVSGLILCPHRRERRRALGRSPEHGALLWATLAMVWPTWGLAAHRAGVPAQTISPGGGDRGVRRRPGGRLLTMISPPVCPGGGRWRPSPVYLSPALRARSR